MNKKRLFLKSTLVFVMVFPRYVAAVVTLKKVTNDSKHTVFVRHERLTKKRSEQSLPIKIAKDAAQEFGEEMVIPVRNSKEKNTECVHVWWMTVEADGGTTTRLNSCYYVDGDAIFVERYEGDKRPDSNEDVDKALKNVGPDAQVMIFIDSQGEAHVTVSDAAGNKRERRKTMSMRVSDWLHSRNEDSPVEKPKKGAQEGN